MTTDLAQCSKCAALLSDTDEDIAKHRRWHAQFESDFETIRRVASTASSDVKALTGTVRDLARPVDLPEPVKLSIRVTDDDELEPADEDLTGYAGEPAESAADDFDTTIYAGDTLTATVALDPADLPVAPAYGIHATDLT